MPSGSAHIDGMDVFAYGHRCEGNPFSTRPSATPVATATAIAARMPLPPLTIRGPQELVIGVAASATTSEHPPVTVLSREHVRVPLRSTMSPTQKLGNCDIAVHIDCNGLKAAPATKTFRLVRNPMLDQSNGLCEVVVHHPQNR